MKRYHSAKLSCLKCGSENTDSPDWMGTEPLDFDCHDCGHKWKSTPSQVIAATKDPDEKAELKGLHEGASAVARMFLGGR